MAASYDDPSLITSPIPTPRIYSQHTEAQTNINVSTNNFPISLTIHCAKNLHRTSFLKNPDAFVRLYTYSKTTKITYIKSTEVKQNEINPQFNTSFKLQDYNLKIYLQIEVWDHKKKDKGAKKGFLGGAILNPQQVVNFVNNGVIRLSPLSALHYKEKVDKNNFNHSALYVQIKSMNQSGLKGASSANTPVSSNFLSPNQITPRQQVGGSQPNLSYVPEIASNERLNQTVHVTRIDQSTSSSSGVVAPISIPNLESTYTPPEPRNYEKVAETKPETKPEYSSVPSEPTGSNPNKYMPPGWSRQIHDDGRVYYVNHHNNNTTTWHDPRVRILQKNRIGLPNPEELKSLKPPWNMVTKNCQNSGKVKVYFTNYVLGVSQNTDPRLSEWLDEHFFNILGVRNPNMNPNIQQTQVTQLPTQSIVQDSPNSQQTQCITQTDRIEHNQALKTRRSLAKRLQYAKDNIFEVNYMHGIYCRINISRNEILEHSYRTILSYKPQNLKNRLVVTFKNESGIDYGGMQREWLNLLSQKLISVNYGLFIYTRDYNLSVSTKSALANPDHLSYFHFAGRLMGMSLYHSMNMHCPLSLPIFKFLLNKAVTLEDLINYDVDTYHSSKYILNCEPDQVEDLSLTFSLDEDDYGRVRTVDLIKDGRNVPVTSENRTKYIKLLIYYKLYKIVQPQLSALRRGLTEIIPQKDLISIFNTDRELNLALNGVIEIDINDWKRHTLYKNCKNNEIQIIWFWEILKYDFDDEMRQKFLHFCTGSSRVPLDGFKSLRANPDKDEPKLFSILLLDDVKKGTNVRFSDFELNQRLPKAHTCFNRLDLPRYTEKAKMLEKLNYCLENDVGFGIE